MPGKSQEERGSLLSPREREILRGEADVSSNYYSTVVSHVRGKIKKMEQDIEALEEHGDLADELREVVCDDP